MFTVLLCGKTFINRLRTDYSYIWDMLLQQQDCTLMTWNPQGATLEEAVPGLKEKVAGKPQWRAVVVQERDLWDASCIDRQNPFDATGTVAPLQDFGEAAIHALLDEVAAMKDDEDGVTEEEAAREESIRRELMQRIPDSAARIADYRRQKATHYAAAVDNPLTRLSIWLLGSPAAQTPWVVDEWPQELTATDATVDLGYYECLRDHGLLALDVEQVHAACQKAETLRQAGLTGSALSNPPVEVLAIGERLATRSHNIFRTAWKTHEELEYTNFCDDNLYPENMRFVLYDVEYNHNVCMAVDYLEFVTFVYLLAGNEVPEGSMRPRRVYAGKTRVDTIRLRRFFTAYLQKLEVTRRLLVNTLRRQEYDAAHRDPVAPQEAVVTFESDVEVPVEIRSAVTEDSLLAKKDVGFAKDCPQDEYRYWYDQMRDIGKNFIRYLREPRRALSFATRHSFRDQSVIDDERIFRLDEDQLEDIHYRLLEEEQKMVETHTPRLFMTKEYTARIDKADAEVREQIERRMTRKKTFITAAIALAAYLFGFLPLVFGNKDTPAAVGVSWALVGIAVGALAAVGFGFLWWMRKRLRDRMTHFNREMSGILAEIRQGLSAFSRYLGYACNMRRGFSVFRRLEQDNNRRRNIVRRHLYDVEEQMKKVNALFITAVDPGEYIADDVKPYNFDFTQPEGYVYDVPYEDADAAVEYIQPGSTVMVPIDYVRSVTLTREELYD